jgi:hypothetical protein
MQRTARSDKNSSTTWKKLTPGASVLKLWRKGDCPQFAILSLTRPAFKKFRKNPKKFLNDFSIFDPPVIQANPVSAIPPGIANNPKGLLIPIAHGRASHAPWTIIPELDDF